MTAKDLKNALLQEAVQGKLVPQIASEGNAKDLLEEIRREKAKLIKEGNLKKEKPLPEITEDDIPFNIPDNWCWCRLSDIGDISRGRSKHRPRNDPFLYENGTIPFIQTGDVANANGIILKPKTFYNKKGLEQSRLWKKGTICLTIAANIGDVAVLDFDACFPDSVVGFNGFEHISDNKYIMYALMWYKDLLDKLSHSTAQKNINLEILTTIAFPLPPLVEQKRIVAAIEKFMPLIDEYGKKETELKAFNEQIGSLTRKAILQEAVQGKLVPQITIEGNAKDLLEKIKKEKAKLIREGKIKKEKTLLEITEDEIPFDIPESWCWCRFGDISTFNGGYAFKSENYVTKENGVRVLRISDFDENGIKDKNPVYYPYNSELENYKLSINDIIMCMTGGTVGKSFLVKDLNEEMYVNQRVADIKCHKLVDIDYIYSVILSHHVQLSIQDNKNSTNDNISADLIKNFLIPLPPLAEQKRIVAAIEKILPLCEKLGE